MSENTGYSEESGMNDAPGENATSPSDSRCLCEVYKGREDEMYLFVDQREKFERVPPALMERFGEPRLVTTLVLTPQRRLARAQAEKVMEALREQGFYLQMPPPKYVQRDAEMADLSVKNEKLPR